MTTTPAPAAELRRISDAVVRKRRRFSVIWLVPLVAGAVAAWLAVVTLRERGPVVTIAFATAEGLEAGKTKVRYKDVEVGTVGEVRLSDDLADIVAVADMSKQVARFMTSGARFWVIRPRVGASGVSGLGTLLSGAYIELDPGLEGAPAASFRGLDEPPPIASDVPGRRFLLHADSLGSADHGSPIHYRGLQVGQVLGHTLDDNRRTVTLEIFVDAPHDALVRDASRFWNASGIDVSVGAGGVEVSTGSLQTIIAGGIAFDTPGIEEPGEPSESGHGFPLYENRRKVDEPVFTTRVPYLAHFTGSVRGLRAGAPVEFAGIQVGSVTDVRLVYDVDTKSLGVPVAFEIEPERVGVRGARPEMVPHALMRGLVQQGLRAQLKSGNLLTGELVVDLGFHPEAAPAELRTDTGGHPEIPSVPAELEAITSSVNQVLSKIVDAQIPELVADLRHTVQGLDRLVSSPETLGTLTALRQTATAATVTLRNADTALSSVGTLVGANSQLRNDTSTLMVELTSAARSIRALTTYLERHPESLIRGKSGGY
jgi:paraquat-inducible protein B